MRGNSWLENASTAAGAGRKTWSAASKFEYRHRYLLHAIVYALGFLAPWNYWLHIDPTGPNAHVWGILALRLLQAGVPGIGIAFNILLLAAIASAAAGAWLRIWGTAYLGGSIVESGKMHTGSANTAEGVIEAGPFRLVRNPLYLGTILHTFALALLMPASGAIFAVVLVCLLQIRLILAEEAFLTERVGAPYLAFCRSVPRLLPALRPRLTAQPLIPRWGQALLTETYMWGVALSYLVVGWHYSSVLLTQCVVVSLGVSLVVRAIKPVR